MDHGQSPVRRNLRRTLHQSHAGVIFKRPPAHEISDSPRRNDDPRLQRNGTTTLFAALKVLDATVIGRNMQRHRHRHQEFIRFLNTIEAKLPPDKAVQIILDNYATHKQPKVRA